MKKKNISCRFASGLVKTVLFAALTFFACETFAGCDNSGDGSGYDFDVVNDSSSSAR